MTRSIFLQLHHEQSSKFTAITERPTYSSTWWQYCLLQLAERDIIRNKVEKFNIASEASYVYILSGQKLIENPQNGQFDEFLKT